MQVVFDHAGEGFGNWDRFSPKGTPHPVRGENDGGRVKRGDPDQWLGVESSSMPATR
jgi:hypothetical protein